MKLTKLISFIATLNLTGVAFEAAASGAEHTIEPEILEELRQCVTCRQNHPSNSVRSLFLGVPLPCSICLENFNEDDIIIKLDCEHIYHNPCLEKWLSIYNNKCPKCRKEVGESKPNI